MKDFSHYILKRPKKISNSTFRVISKSIEQLIDNSVPKIAGATGIDDPVTTDHLILFNGSNDEACEDFIFHKEEPSTGLNSIRTMALPYDMIVQSSLLVIKAYLGNEFDFSTDGTFEEWRTAIGYTRLILDIDIPHLFPEQKSNIVVTGDLVDMSQYKQNELKKELEEILLRYTNNHDICIK